MSSGDVEYDPPESVFTPEEVKDDPKKPWKAYVSAASSALLAFIGYYVADTDPFTFKEAAEGFGVALLASGLVGLPTYFTSNPKVIRPHHDGAEEAGLSELGYVVVVLLAALVLFVLITRY